MIDSLQDSTTQPGGSNSLVVLFYSATKDSVKSTKWNRSGGNLHGQKRMVRKKKNQNAGSLYTHTIRFTPIWARWIFDLHADEESTRQLDADQSIVEGGSLINGVAITEGDSSCRYGQGFKNSKIPIFHLGCIGRKEKIVGRKGKSRLWQRWDMGKC